MKTNTSFKKQRNSSCLTKAKLLDYVFDRNKKDEQKIENHLEICGHCLQQFKLIQGLRQRIMWGLSFNLEREPIKSLIRKFINAIKKGPQKGPLYYQYTCLSENTIHGYIDGTLEAFHPKKYKSVESHLLTCDSCLKRVRSFWKDYKKFVHSKEEEVHPELLKKSLNNINYVLQKYKNIKLPELTQIRFKRHQHKPFVLRNIKMQKL